MVKRGLVAVLACLMVACLGGIGHAEEACIQCHAKRTPGLVKDWRSSKHAENDVTCSECHGDRHKSATDYKKAVLPDEHKCAECHEKQFNQFKRGKHQFGWSTLMALPVTHLEPHELMEGGRGCGGCHNMGIKTEAQKKKLREMGYRYQNNSCDECHTRHSFSKAEARNPRACEQCHMGYDHPQWEMWSSSKHGERWFAKQAGYLPKDAPAPVCQDCHMPNGNHEVHTAWGFLGVRLPLPKDKQWAADRVTILKFLGVLDPNTGKPTPILKAVKQLDMARLTQDAWQKERDKMIKTCSRCHSEAYARTELEMGDQMLKHADHIMARAIKIVADLYKDGIIKKKPNYPFAYPNLLFFERTGGGDFDKATHIEQILFQMYLKHRMRAYQAFFHVNPDYAYWYGWAMMTKDLVEIQDLAKTMRAEAAAK